MVGTFHRLASHSSRLYDLIVGDISSTIMLGMRYVVNSSRAFSKNRTSNVRIDQNRPHLTMASDLVGLSNVILFMDCNDRFRQCRKLFCDLFGIKNSTAAFNSIEEETRRCLRIIMRKPEDPVNRLITPFPPLPHALAMYSKMLSRSVLNSPNPAPFWI